MTDTETSKNVTEAKKLVRMLKNVAADATERARVFAEYVDLLDKATELPKEIEMIERGWLKDPSTAFDILERIEAVSHVHSGGSDATRIRQAQRALFEHIGGRDLMGV